ncbi:unnamed protein product [Withania somnifera]
MPCLRLLIVKGDELRHYEPVSDTIKYLPSSLKWLDWSYYSFDSLPASFQPRNLVGLKMTFSSLVEICKEPKILSLSLSYTTDDKMSYSITFPEREKILLKLPQDWYDNRFKGFAICCVACMGAGVHDPDSGLSGKYDHTFIKAKLICNNQAEELKVLEKECKVSTTSRNYSWAFFATYGLLEASIQRKITRQWGVHLVYKSERQIFERRTEKKLLEEKLSQIRQLFDQNH